MTANLWGGRFEEAASDLLRRFNDSFSFDRELFAVDVQGSMAWAKALEGAGVLTGGETTKIVQGLEAVAAPVSGDPNAYEDIHSYVEARLRDQVGELAGKLHTGRSRNDQVATDLKLWLKNAASELELNIVKLARTLATRAGDEAALPCRATRTRNARSR